MARSSHNAALAVLKVAGQIALEKIQRPMARKAEDVPACVQAITPEWLTAVLAREHPGAQVTGLEVQTASAGTHERHRLIIAWNAGGEQAGLPQRVFTKSLPSIVTRMVAGFNGHARIEGRFYRDVRPELQIEAPVCYHSTYDKRSFAAIHLLEDLVASKGATFCDYRTEVTRAMAEDMVDLLATLHGRFYDSPRLTQAFRWLADYPTWFLIGAEKMGFERYTDKALDVGADVIPPALRRRRRELWPAVIRALQAHRVRPNVFLHSDVHIGNWYQTTAGRMGLCDWQCPSKGHWSRDFAYAVSAALTPEHRREWERELLRRYLERLHEASGVRHNFDESWTLYRQQILHALIMWTITLCHSPFLPSMQPEAMTLAMIHRMTTAICDLESLDSFI
jgi:hypothetical protein